MTIDDALEVALGEAFVTGTLPSDVYADLSSDMGDTELAAFTMGLVEEGIEVSGIKNVPRKPTEDNYYKQKTKQMVKNPDVSKMKPYPKKPTQKPHDPKASFHLNKVLDKLKEYDDGFLSPWKREAQSLGIDVLDWLAQMAAESAEMPNWEAAEATQEVVAIANEFEDALEDALRQVEGYFTVPIEEVMMDHEAPYLVLMTLRGEGVGIWDGRWDDIVVSPDSISEIESVLKSQLGQYADDTGGGRLNDALMNSVLSPEASGMNPQDVIRVRKHKVDETNEDESVDAYNKLGDMELIQKLMDEGKYDLLDKLYFDKYTASAAKHLIAQRIDEEKRKLEEYIVSQPIEEEQKKGWLSAIRQAFDFKELKDIWDQLFGETVEQPTEQRWEDSEPEDYGMIDLGGAEAKVKRKIKFDNDTVFTVDTADTPAKRSAGLEPYDALNSQEGLLFTFEKPDHVVFHMGKVQFPIDIVFLMKDEFAPDFKVAKIIHNAQPGALDHWSNPNTSRVLEVAGGMCAEFSIQVGSRCTVVDSISVG